MKVRPIVDSFSERIRKLYGEQLHQIIIYGSWVRGTATPESDIDLAVVLARDIHPGTEIDRMLDIITDVNLEFDTLISVYPVSLERFETIRSPLILNIKKEGVEV